MKVHRKTGKSVKHFIRKKETLKNVLNVKATEFKAQYFTPILADFHY